MPIYYTIFGIFGILLIVIGLLTMVDWYKVFNRKWGDNPAKARVYVEYGEKIEPCEGKLYGVLEDCAIYQFTWNKTEHMVQVPHTYPWKFIRGYRKIRYFPGNAWAQPLEGESCNYKGGSRELNVTIEGQTTIDMVKSVKGRKAVGIIGIIVIVAVVIVGGWFVYNNFIADNEPTPIESQEGIINE